MSALMTGLGGWGAAWLCIGAGCAIVLAGCGLAAIALGVRGWLRSLPALWDDGDGQGGVPSTRPLPLAGLVIEPELERHAAWRAAQLAREAAAEVIPGLDDEEGWPWP